MSEPDNCRPALIEPRPDVMHHEHADEVTRHTIDHRGSAALDNRHRMPRSLAECLRETWRHVRERRVHDPGVGRTSTRSPGFHSVANPVMDTPFPVRPRTTVWGTASSQGLSHRYSRTPAFTRSCDCSRSPLVCAIDTRPTAWSLAASLVIARNSTPPPPGKIGRSVLRTSSLRPDAGMQGLDCGRLAADSRLWVPVESWLLPSSQSRKEELEYTPIGALFQFHIRVAQRVNLFPRLNDRSSELSQLPALILNHFQSCGTVRL